MAVTPALLLLDDAWGTPAAVPLVASEPLPEHDGHVIVAGFGRVGQITARILRAKRIPFTALDVSAEQVDFVKKFGSQVFYGDAARPDILAAAKADKATAFVLAIDDVEASMRTAQLVKSQYPNLPIYARARNRIHAHRLMDLGVKAVHRETFVSALELSGDVLRGLGQSERDVRQALTMFRRLDEARLFDDYKIYSDTEKLQERARSDAVNLEQLFDEDAAAQLRNKAATSDRLNSPLRPPAVVPDQLVATKKDE
jgi:voltage-gated potassium channel Kch